MRATSAARFVDPQTHALIYDTGYEIWKVLEGKPRGAVLDARLKTALQASVRKLVNIYLSRDGKLQASVESHVDHVSHIRRRNPMIDSHHRILRSHHQHQQRT